MSNVKISTAGGWFDELWGEEDSGPSEYPFRLRVLVAGSRVTPEHSMFEYLREFGSAFIPHILRHEPLGLSSGKDKKAELLFVFPERWMSVHEQFLFIRRLATHPEAAKLSRVDIITQEVLIVVGLSIETVKVFNLRDKDPEAGLLDREMK